MGLPHITSFCWCMGLETGTRLIGFLHLITSVCVMIIFSVFAASAAQYSDDPLYSAWHTIAVIIAAVSILHIFLACTLLYASYSRSWRAALAWVWAMAALAAVALLYLTAAAVMGFNGSGSDIFVSLLQGALFFGILGYCLLCVYSYHLMLKSVDEMEAPNKHDF